MTDFDLSHAQQFLQSSELYPVSLDDAWQWLGYSRKDKLVEILKNNFEEGFDFSLTTGETPQGGRPSDLYCLTVDCFKQCGMLAKTEKGKQVRKYFIECERVAKQASTISKEMQQFMVGVQQQLNLLTERTERLNELEQHQIQFNAAAQLHPGCADILADQIDADIEIIEMSTKEWLDHLGLDYKYLNTISKRASTFQKCGKKSNTVRKNKSGHVLIEIKYLRQATKLTLGL
jgi:phage anti-repressor protein